MLSSKDSLKILKKTDALLDGHFVLSSGLHSSKYIQCAKLLSYPQKSDLICKSLAKKIRKNFKNKHWFLPYSMGILGFRQLLDELYNTDLPNSVLGVGKLYISCMLS